MYLLAYTRLFFVTRFNCYSSKSSASSIIISKKQYSNFFSWYLLLNNISFSLPVISHLWFLQHPSPTPLTAHIPPDTRLPLSPCGIFSVFKKCLLFQFSVPWNRDTFNMKWQLRIDFLLLLRDVLLYFIHTYAVFKTISIHQHSIQS